MYWVFHNYRKRNYDLIQQFWKLKSQIVRVQIAHFWFGLLKLRTENIHADFKNSISPCWNILLWNLHVSLKPAAEVNCISDTLRKMLSWSWKMKKSENVHRLRNVQSSAQRWTDRSSKVGTQANQTRSLWWWRRKRGRRRKALSYLSFQYASSEQVREKCAAGGEKMGGARSTKNAPPKAARKNGG